MKGITNAKLQYLNVQCTGLSARPHPVLAWVLTTQDVVIVRPHIKMLAGDYLCYAFLAHDRGIDPHCRLCHSHSYQPAPAEDMEHLLTSCRATAETRGSRMPELLNTVSHFYQNHRVLNCPSQALLTQFILDCSSLNLPTDTRVPPEHHGFTDITKQCSMLINNVHRDRTRQLKALGLLG